MTVVRAASIRSRLVLLAMACIVPASLMAVMLISYDYQQARAQLIRNSISTARAMVLVVDRDFASVEATLVTLATSPYLTSDDLPAFYDQANDVLRSQLNTNIALSDVAGKQYINTLRPFGTALPPRSNPRQFQLVADTGQTVISNLFIGQMTNRPVVAMGVPVRRGGKFLYHLSARMFAERFGRLLGQQTLPPGWIGAILDQSGTIVARTHDMSRFVGMKATPDLLKEMAEASEGSYEGATKEGIPVLVVFSRSSISNWTVAIGIPTKSLNAELWNRFFWLIFATVALLASSLGFAWLIGGRIAKSVRGLAAPALALGSGERVKVTAFHLREADEVGLALVKASEMLLHAQHRANHDVLTGLANRALFKEIVSQQLALCERNSTRLSVLYIDLDGFKAVNDGHGHATGDKLLRMVAERLNAGIRKSDVVARLGGDEFTVLLVNAAIDEAEVVAQTLAESLSVPYRMDELVIEISASIGVAGVPQHGTSSKALLHHADDAMYSAKAMGRGCVVVAAN